jgi:hypothetical protein
MLLKANPWTDIDYSNRLSISGTFPLYPAAKRMQGEGQIDADYRFVNGQTSFFRELALYENLFKHIQTLDQEKFDILIAAGSVGAEAYSAIILARMMGLDKKINIHMTDISEPYLGVAREGIYQENWMNGLPYDLSSYFNSLGNGYVQINADIRESLTVRQAEDLRNIDTSQQYDCVIGLNILMHIRTNRASFYSMEDFIDIVETEKAKSKHKTRAQITEELNAHTIKDDIDPILNNLCRLSRRYLCLNMLKFTPYPSSVLAKSNDNPLSKSGFSHAMTSEWKKVAFPELSNQMTDYHCKKSRGGAYVFTR